MGIAPAETWIFGYGSLMWNPGFVFAEARRARLTGYHRAFCIYSIHYRGTERRPGLVLGLDRGGVCEGVAFRVAPERREETLAYLRRRELIYGVYREALVPVELVPEGGLRAAPSYPTHHAAGVPSARRVGLSPPGRGEEDTATREHVASPRREETGQAPRSGGAPGEGAPTVWAFAYLAERAHPAYAGRLPLVRVAHLIRSSAGRGGTNLAYLASTLRHLEELGIREPGLDRLAALAGPLALREAAAGRPGPLRCPTGLTQAWASRPRSRPRTVRDNRFGYRAKLG